MTRAYATLTIKTVDEQKRTFAGIASTPSTDRMGDVIEPKGAQFKLPLPLLWQHDQRDPIGWVTRARVTADGIEIEGEVASVSDAGALKDRLALAWQMIKAKLVRGLSIGFNPLEHAKIDSTFGYRFTKWEWLELSAVTIPANVDATITVVRSIDAQYLAALGRAAPFITPGAAGATRSVTMKSIQEQLADLRTQRQSKAARMGELKTFAEGNGNAFGDAERAEFDALRGEIVALDDQIRFKEVDLVNLSSLMPITPSRGPTFMVKKTDKDEAFPGQWFVRKLIAKALARLDDVAPSAIAEKRWGVTNPNLVAFVKANEVAAGGTASGDWGAELVAMDGRFTGDFIEFLTSRTVYDKLPLRRVPANVTIKGQDGTATGYWVGEKKAIPMSAQDFSTVNLTPLKVAALTALSNELLRDSSPSAEMLVRDALVDASGQRVDQTFIGAAAAVAGVSPAGMLNGLSAGSASGTDADALRADLMTLYTGFITAKNASGLALIMQPALAKQIQLMRNALGVREFPDINQNGGTLEGDPVYTGDNVGAGDFILLKPSDIYRIGDSGVTVSISREAMIEQSSAPTGDGDTPTSASQAMVSMFQNEQTAFKVVRSINFAKRRTGCVAYIGNANYGAATT